MSQTVEIHKYVGEVDELTPPAGNGPWKVKLGVDSGQYRNSKTFVAWPTDYTTKEPNAFLTVLQAAHASKDTVEVSYFTKTKQGQKGPYPQNTITEVVVVGGAPAPSNDSGWAAPAPANPPSSSQGAAPSTIDNVKFVASQLRATAADFINFADLLEGK